MADINPWSFAINNTPNVPIVVNSRVADFLRAVRSSIKNKSATRQRNQRPRVRDDLRHGWRSMP